MAQPDFIIIGAMKCGTSTLQTQLSVQPGIFMTTPKEPNFFSDDEVFAQGMDWYHSLFEPAAVDDLKGEASTHYTKLPTYPDTIARMADALESPKLIYMIRNPVDRAVSHFMHEWSEGRLGKDMERGFRDHPELTQYGCYGMQLATFVARFGLENICLTSLEQLKTSPDQELARITAFLGYGRIPAWQPAQPAQNVSRDRIRRLPLHDLLIDSRWARKMRHALIPKALRQRVWQARSFG
ncbi:sulfotransferase domain-containing protein, partial [Hyphomonas sp.]|uniref:sulfotransferase family protein n=1 Tax=Hyphomonas sp. TaxID=87 RepID=UPI0032975BD7